MAETKLLGNEQLNVIGFNWFGHNRVVLHRRAPCGSGGVGFLVRENLLEVFNISVLDNSVEGIMWLNLSAKGYDSEYNVCVCVLSTTRG